MNTNQIFKMQQTINAELSRVVDYIDKCADVFGEMDLKLHDAFFYTSDMEEDFPLCAENLDVNDWFYRFCDDTFEEFKEFIESTGRRWSDVACYIGRTSHFYLFNDWSECTDSIYQQVIEKAMGDSMYCYASDYFEIGINGVVVWENNLENGDYRTAHDLERLKDVLYYVTNYCQPIINIYNYISYTKKNQIDYFKDWLSFYEDDYKYQEELRIQKENADKSRAFEIAEKHGITPAEMEELKTCIYAY